MCGLQFAMYLRVEFAKRTTRVDVPILAKDLFISIEVENPTETIAPSNAYTPED